MVIGLAVVGMGMDERRPQRRRLERDAQPGHTKPTDHTVIVTWNSALQRRTRNEALGIWGQESGPAVGS